MLTPLLLLLALGGGLFAGGTYVLAAHGDTAPGRFLGRHLPLLAIRAMRWASDWFDAGETPRRAVPAPAGGRPTPVDHFGFDAVGERPANPVRPPHPAPASPPPPLPPPPPPGPPPAPPVAMMDGPAQVPPGVMAQSDLLSAVHALIAQASMGDIRDVRKVIRTLGTTAEGMGQAVMHLATRLAEPDKHYGHEIWEPLNSGGAQMCASSMHVAQSDAGLASLSQLTVDELAGSPRQAPHHSQLNGGA